MQTPKVVALYTTKIDKCQDISLIGARLQLTEETIKKLIHYYQLWDFYHDPFTSVQAFFHEYIHKEYDTSELYTIFRHEAAKHWEQQVEINPDTPTVYYALMQALVQTFPSVSYRFDPPLVDENNDTWMDGVQEGSPPFRLLVRPSVKTIFDFINGNAGYNARDHPHTAQFYYGTTVSKAVSMVSEIRINGREFCRYTKLPFSLVLTSSFYEAVSNARHKSYQQPYTAIVCVQVDLQKLRTFRPYTDFVHPSSWAAQQPTFPPFSRQEVSTNCNCYTYQNISKHSRWTNSRASQWSNMQWVMDYDDTNREVIRLIFTQWLLALECIKENVNLILM